MPDYPIMLVSKGGERSQAFNAAEYNELVYGQGYREPGPDDVVAVTPETAAALEGEDPDDDRPKIVTHRGGQVVVEYVDVPKTDTPRAAGAELEERPEETAEEKPDETAAAPARRKAATRKQG